MQRTVCHMNCLLLSYVVLLAIIVVGSVSFIVTSSRSSQAMRRRKKKLFITVNTLSGFDLKTLTTLLSSMHIDVVHGTEIAKQVVPNCQLLIIHSLIEKYPSAKRHFVGRTMRGLQRSHIRETCSRQIDSYIQQSHRSPEKRELECGIKMRGETGTHSMSCAMDTRVYQQVRWYDMIQANADSSMLISS